jgi:hypothetical protein
VLTEEKLKIGEWVKVIDHDYLDGYVGFITDFDLLDEEYRIRVTRTRKGEPINRSHKWVEVASVVLLPIEKYEDDLLALIDLALDTNDTEWFFELTSQLPEELPW